VSSAICSGTDNYYFRLTVAQFVKLPSLDFMATEHQKAALQFPCRVIDENQNVSAVFLALDYYRAKGEFIYLSHEI
jgi:hypothetical protein